MARIVDHLPLDELETRYRAARDATEARHIQAIWLLAQGRTFLEVAEVLAFAPRRVEAHIRPLLGAVPVSAVTRDDVDRRMRRIIRAPGDCFGVW